MAEPTNVNKTALLLSDSAHFARHESYKLSTQFAKMEWKIVPLYLQKDNALIAGLAIRFREERDPEGKRPASYRSIIVTFVLNTGLVLRRVAFDNGDESEFLAVSNQMVSPLYDYNHKPIWQALEIMPHDQPHVIDLGPVLIENSDVFANTDFPKFLENYVRLAAGYLGLVK